MNEVANLHGDVGEILLTEEEIAAKVRELGARIGADYQGRRLTLVSVLKGSLPCSMRPPRPPLAGIAAPRPLTR